MGRCGLRKLILTVLGIFGASGLCLAQWHPQAWPSEDKYWITTPVLVTNVYAQFHREVWTQTSTTNYIPELPSTFGSRTGIAGAVTNARTWTNEYLTDIEANVPSNTVATWGPGTGYWTNNYAFASNQTLTTSLSHYTNGVQTNLNLDVQDLWAWDSYMAMTERDVVLRSTNDVRSSSSTAPKPRFYFSNRDALVETKQWLLTYVPSFLDTRYCGASSAATKNALNANRYIATNSVGYVSSVYTTNFTVWSATSLCSYLEIPAHILQPTGSEVTVHTPWFDLGGSWPYDRVVTGSWTFAQAGTSTVVDFCGIVHTGVVHTAGQTVYYTCTNEWIEPGSVSSDYTWKHIPKLFAELRWTQRFDFDGWPSESHHGYAAQESGSAATCEQIPAASTPMGIVTDPWSGTRLYVAGSGAWAENGGPPYTAFSWYRSRRIEQPILIVPGSPQCSIEIYAVAFGYSQFAQSHTADDFKDFDGLGFREWEWTVLQSWPESSGIVRGGTNEWNWGAARTGLLPTAWTCPIPETTYRTQYGTAKWGFVEKRCAVWDYRTILRWDGANGFKYLGVP